MKTGNWTNTFWVHLLCAEIEDYTSLESMQT